MTEENITTEEKSRERYFYVSKECTYKFLSTVGASFIGALLAIAVFSALHKPPIPPIGPQIQPNRPCPCQMIDRGHGRILPPGGEFKRHKHMRGEFGKGAPNFGQHSEFNRKDFRKVKWNSHKQNIDPNKNIKVQENVSPNKK